MKTPGRRAAMRLPGCCVLLAALSAPVAAVPIPWKNCGAPGDLLSVQLSDASVWPPSVAAPFNATATVDTSGQIANLSVFLALGLAWTFDTGPLPASATGGFVTLPASMPVTVTSPPLPIAPGPYNVNHTFRGEGSQTTVVSKSNVLAQVKPPLSATLSLSFNGTPGFPLRPRVGAYSLQVQIIEPSGPGVFCLDLTMPLKTAAPVVNVVGTPSIPLLSPTGLALLVVLVAGCGCFAWRRRMAGAQRRGDPVS